jgi:hypothetical protein
MRAYIVVSLVAGMRSEGARVIGWEEDVDLDGNPPSVAVPRGSGPFSLNPSLGIRVRLRIEAGDPVHLYRVDVRTGLCCCHEDGGFVGDEELRHI